MKYVRKIIDNSPSGYLHADTVFEFLDASGLARTQHQTVTSIGAVLL